MNYTISEIAKIVNGTLTGECKLKINHLTIDSRSVSFPPQSVFFALIGSQHNGHKYISDLYNQGIRAFIVSENIENKELLPASAFVSVKNTRKALQQLSAYHRKQWNKKTVAITGSNGKTIVKEWLYQLLQQDINLIRSPKSYNSQVGVPLSVWMLKAQHEMGVFEAGISQPGEMKQLSKIIAPDIGIFVNIGDAHQENFISTEQKILEKLVLFKNCKTLIYRKDYDIIHSLVQKNLPNTSLITWSVARVANLQINSIRKQKNITTITGTWMYKNTQYNHIEINIPFTDEASIENAIHCWTFMLWFGYNNQIIARRMRELIPLNMRLELLAGINNCTLINDSYNSDLASVRIALDYLTQQNIHPVKTVILSDIEQSETNETKLYNDLAELFKRHKINKLITIGRRIGLYKTCFNEIVQVDAYRTTEALLSQFHNIDFYNEAILIKGARNFGFERISKRLQQKNHRTVLETDLNALVHNLNFYRSLLSPQTKLMVMVKAFSYGSGSYEIANELQFQRVDYLGVAYIDEGVLLRQSGIRLPIFVMNPDLESFDALIANNLEPEIYSFEILDALLQKCRKAGITNIPVHIKLDTGMRRLGFEENEVDTLVARLQQTDVVDIKSVFSHLAASDVADEDQFTLNQIETFIQLSSKICKKLRINPLRHILNTSGIERFNLYQFDMVRLGIGLYGISENYTEKLEPTGTLKTRISQIKELQPPDTIGYGRMGKLATPSHIATIPIGYADGIPRCLGNGKGSVLIHGKSAPFIGNICMDMCMIDISGIQAKTGDEVILFGKEQPITKMAKQAGTISYEIMTGISHRVKKIYYRE